MLTIKSLNLYLKKDLRQLFSDFSFSLNPGMRVALIGEEGNGKSTLLKAIFDKELLYEYVELRGEISKPGEIIGYLPQELQQNDIAVKDFVFQMGESNSFDYNLLYTLMGKMGIDETLIIEERMMGSLSGGEKVKLQLLKILLGESTILLLDEPSNDLDVHSVLWLEQFISSQQIPIMFISHDEELIQNCANVIIHFEQIHRKSKPRYTIANDTYDNYMKNRQNQIEHQNQVARKEEEEYEKQQERYRQIYQKVEHEQNVISRQNPRGGALLKKKMRSVKSMGKRFERDKERMTQKVDLEDGIFVSFDTELKFPNGKIALDFKLDSLDVGEKHLTDGIQLKLTGPRKVVIIGENGIGKTTLLRRIYENLLENGIPCGYMPQNYSEKMPGEMTAIDFLAQKYTKEETTKNRKYLGSLRFTSDEMTHPIRELSGGQKAKLFFAKMVLDGALVLVLDEPTRNLSPLSGPVVRESLINFGGAIISVSHDRKYIGEVCQEVYQLRKDGLNHVGEQELAKIFGNMTHDKSEK